MVSLLYIAIGFGYEIGLFHNSRLWIVVYGQIDHTFSRLVIGRDELTQ